jgi:signal peptidase II
MKLKKRAILIVSILIVSVVLDQVTKIIAQTYLKDAGGISFLHDIFTLHYAENTGGFLGMGSAVSVNLRFWVFTVLVALFLAVMLFFLIFSKSFSARQVYALSGIIGGGIGNLIDRVINEGRVVDFMVVGIGSLRTGIFNVADLFITFGALFLVLFIVMDEKKRKQNAPISDTF